MTRRTFIIALLAFWSLWACGEIKRAMGGISECIDATVRISVPEGRGTGVFFQRDAENIFALTNCHVVSDGNGERVIVPRVGKPVGVDIWRAGFESGPYPGRVEWTSYQAETSRDIAIVSVKLSALKGYVPPMIPLAPAGQDGKAGDSVLSMGCSKGAWPSMFRGHLRANLGASVVFYPNPAQGRSGSALFNASGTAIIGLLCWQDVDKQEQGGGLSLAEIYRALEGKPAGINQRTARKLSAEYIDNPPLVQVNPSTWPWQRQYQSCPPGGCPQQQYQQAPQYQQQQPPPQRNEPNDPWRGGVLPGPIDDQQPAPPAAPPKKTEPAPDLKIETPPTAGTPAEPDRIKRLEDKLDLAIKAGATTGLTAALTPILGPLAPFAPHIATGIVTLGGGIFVGMKMRARQKVAAVIGSKLHPEQVKGGDQSSAIAASGENESHLRGRIGELLDQVEQLKQLKARPETITRTANMPVDRPLPETEGEAYREAERRLLPLYGQRAIPFGDALKQIESVKNQIWHGMKAQPVFSGGRPAWKDDGENY